jgi:hypothetical protein
MVKLSIVNIGSAADRGEWGSDRPRDLTTIVTSNVPHRGAVAGCPLVNNTHDICIRRFDPEFHGEIASPKVACIGAA